MQHVGWVEPLRNPIYLDCLHPMGFASLNPSYMLTDQLPAIGHTFGKCVAAFPGEISQPPRQEVVAVQALQPEDVMQEVATAFIWLFSRSLPLGLVELIGNGGQVYLTPDDPRSSPTPSSAPCPAPAAAAPCLAPPVKISCTSPSFPIPRMISPLISTSYQACAR